MSGLGQSLQVVCRWAGREVRFGPTTDLIPNAQSGGPCSSSSVTEPRRMTMQDQVSATCVAYRRVPWNKGKLTGAKPPLRPKRVWSIRTKLQIEARARALAMFNLAIDSKLR